MKKKGPIVCLLCAFCLAGCLTSNENDIQQNDPTGVYVLVTVNGAELPASVKHGEVPIVVHAGSFTINGDGSCSSKTIFGPPSGGTVTREVNATYTQEGSILKMKWQGAGRTEGKLQGSTFNMNNEGMIFSYKK